MSTDLMPTYKDLDTSERMLLLFEVEEFLKHEASLLDERRYNDWLELIAEDIHYWMPVRRTVMAANIEEEFTRPGEVAFIDDNRMYLEMRIKRLLVGSAWAENPPSRTRHFITNVRVTAIDGDEITVSSNFHLYRTRLESEEDSWIGRREDVLRRNGNSFKLARRHVFIDQTVILSQNMSNIF